MVANPGRLVVVVVNIGYTAFVGFRLRLEDGQATIFIIRLRIKSQNT